MQYNEKKAAQIAAFFISQDGGAIGILKLMKLMYLAERESFQRYGEPMTGDKLCSMEHGPVLSTTYNHCNNMITSKAGGWESWIRDREDNMLSLKVDGNIIPLLTELSESDEEILQDIWAKFGAMTGSQLRNYTHKHCPEWEDPDGSSIPIKYSKLLSSIGYKDEVVNELIERITQQRYIDSHLS